MHFENSSEKFNKQQEEIVPQETKAETGDLTNTSEKEIREKSLLEKIYKSKTARMVALLGLLGIGSKMADVDKYFEGIYFGSTDKEKTATTERQEVRVAGPLEILIDEIPYASNVKRHISKGAEKTIVHLGQYHGSHSFEELKILAKMSEVDENVFRKEIIESQKNIEKQIVYLKNKYKAENIFLEDIDIETINTYKLLKESVKNSEQASQFAEHWDKLFNSYKSLVSAEDLTEQHKARMVYLIKISLEKELENLKIHYSQKDDIEVKLPDKHKQLFNLWDRNKLEPESVFKYLESQFNEVKNNNLIKEENIYLWGSPAKLFMEDKINILPAEDREVNKKVFDEKFTDEQLKTPAIQKKIMEKQELREDAALKFIEELNVGQKVIPLIYGAGHDFSNNITKFSKGEKGEYNLIEINREK